MFTGLVEEVGTVAAVKRTASGICWAVSCREVLPGLAVGDSIAVDGVCLTVTALRSGAFAVDVVGETLARTTIGTFTPGRQVNLERARRADDRLGGHLVQGHVDGVAEVAQVSERGEGRVMRISLPGGLHPFVVPKGAVAVDGVSLTVARIVGQALEIWLVPHTLAKTTLRQKRVGDLVNVEVDVLAKYVARMLSRDRQDALSMEKLREWGY
ncbi:MAG: riboflavin synthase [bacterium]|jgi:riboflavin synthase|nr:riboflavin synthase [candidate division KSB1 bacterium]MDH7558798.1 riboflavin synthase [bacterium]